MYIGKQWLAVKNMASSSIDYRGCVVKKSRLSMVLVINQKYGSVPKIKQDGFQMIYN